jgi:hypothetical protein
VRLRSPALIVAEMWQLKKLGIHNIHMCADLFTVNREQVVALCPLSRCAGPTGEWLTIGVSLLYSEMYKDGNNEE